MEIEWKTEKPHTYSCCECGKIYANKSGLWKHRKKCPLLIQDIVNKDNLDFKEMFLEAMQQNKELPKTMVFVEIFHSHVALILAHTCSVYSG